MPWRASGRRSRRTRTPWTTAGPTTSSRRSVPTAGHVEGHDGLREAYAQWTPRRPQRHLVVNTLVTDWDDHQATAVSDVVFAREGKDGWAIQFVSRYHDTLHHDAGTWRFHHREVA